MSNRWRQFGRQPEKKYNKVSLMLTESFLNHSKPWLSHKTTKKTEILIQSKMNSLEGVQGDVHLWEYSFL